MIATKRRSNTWGNQGQAEIESGIRDDFYFLKLPRNVVIFSYKQVLSAQFLSGA